MKEQHMGDRAYTTLLAWPYPGREQLPTTVLGELELRDAVSQCDIPETIGDYDGDGVYVLAGDKLQRCSRSFLSRLDLPRTTGRPAAPPRHLRG